MRQIMTNFFKSFLRKTPFAKKQNLISRYDPYAVMAQTLRNHRVTGIIDAGASDGHISKRLLRFFPNAHVYAFEPHPLYAATLQSYASKDHRFEPQFMAISDQEGLVELQITESPGSTSLLSPGRYLKRMKPNGATVKSVEKIEAVTIDEWTRRKSNPPIQLMKFDIQEGELKALRGAARVLQTSTLLVYTEISFNPLYDGGAIYSEIDLCLRKYGFILYDLFKPKYDPTGPLMWGNAIFLHANRSGM
jgi:FkbM family methyltransferase